MPPQVAAIEIQYKADNFLAFFTEQVKLKFAPPDLGVLSGPNGARLYLSRVVFNPAHFDISQADSYWIFCSDRLNPIGQEQVFGKKLLIAQPAMVFLASEADLLQSNAAAPQELPVPVTVTFSLRISIQNLSLNFMGGDPYLSARFENLTVAIAEVQQALNPYLPDLAKSLQFELPLIPAQASKQFKLSSKFANGGIMVDDSLSRVSLLLVHDYSFSAPQNFWKPFFNGQIWDSLQGKDFSLAIQKNALEFLVINQIYNMVSDPDFIAKEVPSLKGKKAYLHGNTATPAWVSPLHFQVKFHLDLPKWCDPIDIGADVQIDLFCFDPFTQSDSAPALIANNTLTTVVTGSFEISSWDKFACTAVQTFLSGGLAFLVGTGLGFVDPVNSALAQIFLTGFVFSTVLGALIADRTVISKPPLPNCKKIGDDVWLCPSTFNDFKNQGVQLDSISGLPHHLLIGGSQQIHSKTPAALSIVIQPFDLFFPSSMFTCDPKQNQPIAAQMRNDPKAYLRASAIIEITRTGELPLKVVKVQMLQDGYHTNRSFTIEVTESGEKYVEILVNFKSTKQEVLVDYSLLPGYFEDPYRCLILVQTSAGTRILSLGPLQMPDSQTLDQLVSDAEQARMVFCKKLQAPISMGFQLDWLIDPEPFQQFSSLWQVALSGLTPQISLEVQATNGQILDQGRVDKNGRTAFSLQAPAGGLLVRGLAGGLLQAGLGAPGAPGPGSPDWENRDPATGLEEADSGTNPGLELRKFILEPMAQVVLTDPLVDAALASFAGRPALLCLAGDRLEVFDLATPRDPALIFELAAPGAAGLIDYPGGFLVWGSCGLFSIGKDGSPSGRGCENLPGGAVQGAAWDGQYFSLLTQGQIHLLNRRFSPVSVLPAAGAMCITAGQGLLFAGFSDRLEAYANEATGPASLISSFPLPGISRAFLPLLLERPRTLLALQDSGGAQLLDYSRPETPSTLASYAQAPWFAGTHRYAALLARADPGSLGVEIFNLTRPQAILLDSSPGPAGRPGAPL